MISSALCLHSDLHNGYYSSYTEMLLLHFFGTKVHLCTSILMDTCKVKIVVLSSSQQATCTLIFMFSLYTIIVLQYMKKSSHFRNYWSFPTKFFLQIIFLARSYLQSVFPPEVCQIFGAMLNKGLTTFVTLNSIQSLS